MEDHSPIAARSIQHALQATAPTPMDNVHAGGVATEREGCLVQGRGPDVNGAIIGGGCQLGVRCISEKEF
jgi:hypothetical protein